jgi:transcriptional regulator with XRE-family HTH domain
MMAGRPPKAVDPDASAAAKLGADLRALRIERELTLTQLGDKIGFSAQYISGAELARTTVSARFVAACDRVLGADGALIALLPDVVWEKELRRQQRSRARQRLAPSPGPASGRGGGADDVDPTDRRGPVDAGAAAALGSGTVVAPTAGSAIDPALPGHLTSLLAILATHDAAHGPREILGIVRRELQVIMARTDKPPTATCGSTSCVSRRAGRSTQPGYAKTPVTRVGASHCLTARCTWPVTLIIPI